MQISDFIDHDGNSGFLSRVRNSNQMIISPNSTQQIMDNGPATLVMQTEENVSAQVEEATTELVQTKPAFLLSQKSWNRYNKAPLTANVQHQMIMMLDSTAQRVKRENERRRRINDLNDPINVGFEDNRTNVILNLYVPVGVSQSPYIVPPPNQQNGKITIKDIYNFRQYYRHAPKQTTNHGVSTTRRTRVVLNYKK